MNAIQEAAAEYQEFKTQLLANPKTAIEELIKFKIPENIEILVYQDTPQKINIVLPCTTDELSDDDLDNISGGVYGSGCSNCPCFLLNL